DLAQRSQIRVSLFGSAHVRFGGDFAERRAAAVVIDVSLGGRLRKTFVEILGGVVFDVQAGDADALLCAGVLDLDPAASGQRKFVLRNLIALGQVGIEIIFARKT